jgi:hypothetical protein
MNFPMDLPLSKHRASTNKSAGRKPAFRKTAAIYDHESHKQHTE